MTRKQETADSINEISIQAPLGKSYEVVVVEDDPRTLKNLVRLVATYPEFRVMGSALCGEPALQLIDALSPQLVLLDLELPDLDGIEVTSRLKASHPEIEVLILTSFDDETKVYRAMLAGAAGYLVKKVAPEKIRDGMLEVLRGGTVIEPRLAKRFWNYFQSVQGKPAPLDDLLSPMEKEVLQNLARGLTNRQVGQMLRLEHRTVKTHLSHIYQKLETSSRSQAVVIALQKGLISL